MEEVQVLTDPEEVKKLLAKGTITDIGAFMKEAAKSNPDLIDPEKFEKKWNEDKAARALKEFTEAAPEAIGTKRAELEEILEKHSPGLSAAFAEMTPKDKFYGQLTAKLSFAISNDEIEKIFTWGEVEFGQMAWREKCLALFQAAELIGTTPANYRGIRKMFLEMVKGNDIEIKPEYLQAEDARQATQKAVCAKLLKVEDIAGVETIFDWAEVELKRQLMVADRYIVFFQIAEMVVLTEDHYKAMRKIFVRMNKD